MSEKQEGKEEKGKGDVRLSEEEKRYYTSILEEADEIVFQYEGNMGYEDDGEPSSDLVGKVFNKIATPLFYLRDMIESMPVAPKKTEEECVKNETAEVMMKVEEEKRAEECTGEHCPSEEEDGSGKEVINEYEEKATINGILGDKVKILGIQEVEEGGFGGSDITVEGIGVIRTYSKVLSGQIQHLKDTEKLPAVGTIGKKKSGKGGRSYYSFSPSSFMMPKDPRTKPIFADDRARTLSDEEKEISEFMEY